MMRRLLDDPSFMKEHVIPTIRRVAAETLIEPESHDLVMPPPVPVDSVVVDLPPLDVTPAIPPVVVQAARESLAIPPIMRGSLTPNLANHHVPRASFLNTNQPNPAAMQEEGNVTARDSQETRRMTASTPGSQRRTDDVTRSGAVKVIGLTSGLACGREDVARILENLGAVVIDCNKIKAEVYLRGTKCHEEIIAAFGDELIGEDQELDQLTDVMVSKDITMCRRLQQIVWPHVVEAVMQKVQELDEDCQMGMYYTRERWMTRRIVVVESQVVIESHLDHLVDELWTVASNTASQVRRLMHQRSISESEARWAMNEFRAMSEQKLNEWQSSASSNACPVVEILNLSGGDDDLYKQVVHQWKLLHLRMYGVGPEKPEPVLEIVNPEDQLIGAAPLCEVWKSKLWHRMAFVVLRHQPSGGFYATRRSRRKEYMPGRIDLAVFGKQTSAAVAVGESPNETAAHALRDKLGISVSPQSLAEVTRFEYRGALPQVDDERAISVVGIVFEIFMDLPPQQFIYNVEEVEEVIILSASQCLALHQHELVPMTAKAYDAYSSYYHVHREHEKMPNVIATPGSERPLEASSEPWLSQDEEQETLPKLFLLGLTGHELSSRRDVAVLLEKLGAVIIDCQRLAAKCYAKGTNCFNEIVKTFGRFIVGEDGAVNERLLGPILHSRSEMLTGFQKIIRPHLFEAVKQRVRNLEEEVRQLQSLEHGRRHMARRVVVIDNTVLRECGMVDHVDEVWCVANNFDNLTRRRISCTQVGVLSPEKRRSRLGVEGGLIPKLRVELQFDENGSLTQEVKAEWNRLHVRMYKASSGLTNISKTPPVSPREQPGLQDDQSEVILEVIGPSGRLVGAAPIPHVREAALAHRIPFLILRHGNRREFYVTRRAAKKAYLPGCLDLALFGRPGSSEVRAGEAPQDTAARALFEKLGTVTPVEPRLVGEFQYHGVLPFNAHKINMFGVLFEVVIDVPIADLSPDSNEVSEILILSIDAVLRVPKSELVPMSAFFFKEYWCAMMGEGLMF
eukprot:gnl/TRDRNA2_/TRDRNA2_139788_c2_seq1.p1 gnl/TRDRNA2_/TRDRNA2_139788_c2~~gnl/TRDRNA2_/TRDRNA2_139788_c2_seq1.p1  ORF type:complete len:1021 (-),score=166.86 gnl/TRDRNA2_/TRDRNA2_139788_c2_seq1:199-3261(-)